MSTCAQIPSSESLRLQEALKRLHDSNDRAKMHIDCLRYVHAASKLSILDTYKRGELALLCEVQAWHEIDDIGRPLEFAEARTGPKLSRFILYLNAVDMPLRQNGDKQPVFVSVCEAVSGPDGCIPSLVRLYLVNDEIEEGGGGNVDLYVSTSKLSLKFWGGPVDRELGIVSNESRSESLDSFEPSVIKGACQVVDGISNHKRNMIESGFIQRVGQSLCTMLRVYLNESSVSVFKSFDAPFEVSNMYIGPVELGSGLKEDHV